MNATILSNFIQFPQTSSSFFNCQEALHVSKDAYFFSGDNGVGFTYNLTEPSASAEVGFLPFFLVGFYGPWTN